MRWFGERNVRCDHPGRALVEALSRLHLGLTVLWLVLAIPSLIWWRNSVPWLVFVSIYANVASHWSAWQGARAEQAATEAT